MGYISVPSMLDKLYGRIYISEANVIFYDYQSCSYEWKIVRPKDEFASTDANRQWNNAKISFLYDINYNF